MFRHRGIIASVVVGLFVLLSFWYFFIDTLRLTEITGKQQNPFASVIINLLDFDTGLTRYDIYNLSKRSDYWQMRMQEVMAIQDPEKRDLENAKLMAEMMEDPSIKKISKKLLGFSADTALNIMKSIK